jgi:hypothetical protein
VTVGSHQTPIGRDDARFTPRWILDALGTFRTDAATGNPRPWDIGVEHNVTEAQDCLTMDWRRFGRTWLNPPFMRYGVAAFVERMCAHNHGVLLLHARTDTPWFQLAKRCASAVLWLLGRVVFCYADGTPCRIENPKSKHYGKVANSGAPVVLLSFGFSDCDVLADCGIAGDFEPLLFRRFALIAALAVNEGGKSWRQIVVAWLACERGPVRVADLYVAFRLHPKARANRNWKAKLRQTLQRGAGRSVGRDQWVQP